MATFSAEELIKIVTDSFEAERTGDVQWGRRLISDDFTQRSMIVGADKLFPEYTTDNLDDDLKRAYLVEGREFHVWNVAANTETRTVFIELAEVEPRGGKKAVWPYVLVCQIDDDGKIKRSRHYGDPAILSSDITVDQVKSAIGS